jgi:hypothetical protein
MKREFTAGRKLLTGAAPVMLPVATLQLAGGLHIQNSNLYRPQAMSSRIRLLQAKPQPSQRCYNLREGTGKDCV